MYATARRLESMDGLKHPNIHTLKLDVLEDDQVSLLHLNARFVWLEEGCCNCSRCALPRAGMIVLPVPSAEYPCGWGCTSFRDSGV